MAAHLFISSLQYYSFPEGTTSAMPTGYKKTAREGQSPVSLSLFNNGGATRERDRIRFLSMIPPAGPRAMGSSADEESKAACVVSGYGERRRPRLLCLHGFRTSGEIMRAQVVGKWPENVAGRLDLVFPDAPFPAEGKSSVEGIFTPPYYEWFQRVVPIRQAKESLKYRNFDECLKYIEDLMIEHEPVDGFMGFSQGAILSGALLGLQAKGVALARALKVKYVGISDGPKFQPPTMVEKAYATKIGCPSLHFIGNVPGDPLLDPSTSDCKSPSFCGLFRGRPCSLLLPESHHAADGHLVQIPWHSEAAPLHMEDQEDPVADLLPVLRAAIPTPVETAMEVATPCPT